MGKQIRKRPERLPGKLLEIRQQLGLSQSEMVRRLGLAGEMERDYVSKFERGTLEPMLHVLLLYARVANVFVDALIDDEIELPATLPAPVKSEGVGTKLRPQRSARNHKD
jgi:transcriptional regulator with XRE-family HTH domain